MSSYYSSLRKTLANPHGPSLGFLFNPNNAEYSQTWAYSSNHAQIHDSVKRELASLRARGLTDRGRDTLIDAVAALWEVVYEIERGDTVRRIQGDEGELGYCGRVYSRQKNLMQIIARGFQGAGWPNWFLPILYVTCTYLREFAIRADEEDKEEGKKPEKLEDAARHLNRGFTLCLSDRAPLEESRKWGTYYMVNLLFKTYFKLNAITLSKNVIRALNAVSADLPTLPEFPKSHIVTYKYYVGVISFLEEDYIAAEKSLLEALHLCRHDCVHNQELILLYLIPAHLIATHQLPSADLYSHYPRLQSLFAPICLAIRAGNLQAFEAALEENEDEYVRRRIYLTLERSRDIALRNLFRRVYLINDKKTRIPVEEFRRAMGFSLAGRDGGTRKEVEAEECECLLAGMIYKGLMKGYLSREKGMVVLSNREPFPGTGS